jgi:hypothetical protein
MILWTSWWYWSAKIQDWFYVSKEAITLNHRNEGMENGIRIFYRRIKFKNKRNPNTVQWLYVTVFLQLNLVYRSLDDNNRCP